ncbi:hypothetical protein CVT24_010586 [Panaeolus cyanescens]|uniref:CxC2-like cysteine cluster KDZ transposase-associated domain-containing protein n=1 Tax=Panaeolus cyanescens TaxID=181874 RepID=A0A409WEC1_9AGAR|nr:hypothetical protein CVT24_010586 [Panaeolus cyanescens]
MFASGKGKKSKGGGANFTVVPHADERPYHARHQGGFLQAHGGWERNQRGSNIEQMLLPNNIWTSKSKWEPADSKDFALDEDDGWYDEAVAGDFLDFGIADTHIPKKPRSKLSKRPHVVWKEKYRSSYLDELCRHSGRGDFRSIDKCRDCGSKKEVQGDAIYRCASECFLADLVCKDCCVKRHRKLPFHRIEKWNGTHFTPVSLKSLGLRIQLNHVSMACASPMPCHTSLSVMHTNGIHEVAFDFCGCEKAEPQHIQLLRRRIYPASQHIIRNCATFELLNHLHKLTLTTKASTYDLHRALDRLTDSTGLRIPKFKYRILFRMFMQWRNLRMLQWSGRALEEDGIAKTEPGEAALLCPSCAHPGKNLPDNWKEESEKESYLYRLFACMDGNFRLKNQLVSNWDQDPGLGDGMAYMIPRKGYEAYVKSQASDLDMSTCVGFQAIAQANTRFSKGLRYTGVGAVLCGRSEMYLPQGMGNLQKGERYANMDYIFGSAMERYKSLKTIVIGYDIACQWFTNLKKRMTTIWPSDLVEKTGDVSFVPAIPKLHEPAHQGENHEQYSLNYIPGVGQTDLEASERGWGVNNGMSNSTKTQGPGSRIDTIDDHLNFWNYEKYIRMGATLLRRYRAALADRNQQTEAHKGLTSSINPVTVEKWESSCKAWDSDQYPKTVENPYKVDTEGYTEADAKRELALEDERYLASGGPIRNETTASSFLIMAIEIEDSQRHIRRLAKNLLKGATARQDAGLTEQRNHLWTRIRIWEILLPSYMPGLHGYRASLSKGKVPEELPEHPDDVKIWLPSHLPDNLREEICHENLAEWEDKLRTGQCTDALESLRHALKIKLRLLREKHVNVRGQKEGTRSRVLIDRAHEKALEAAEKYRWARARKMQLLGEGEWEKTYRVLHDDDIRSFRDAAKPKNKGRRGVLEDSQVDLENMIDAESDNREGEGQGDDEEAGSGDQQGRRVASGQTRHTISWIWLLPRSADAQDDDENNTYLKAEWARSRARSTRATEEVELLKEEMRRTLAFLGWKRNWWLGQIGKRKANKALTEGLQAFATKSADHQGQLALKFRQMWVAPLGKFSPSEFVAEHLGEDEEGQKAGMDEEEEDDEEEEVVIKGDNEDDDDNDNEGRNDVPFDYPDLGVD